MAVTQLKIDTVLIRAVAVVLIGGGAVAFAITFGLGSRALTRNILAGFYILKLLREGETIEIDGIRGVLVAVTPVKTMIEVGEEVVAVANERLLDEVVKVS